MRTVPGILSHPVTAVAVGVGAVAADGAAALYRRATRLPVVGEPLDRGIDALARRGDRIIREQVAATLAQVLDQLDLTELVRSRVDVNAIAREIDIDAIIDRIDLVGLADVVIDGVDLPTIIRQSSSSVTAEVMTDVRTRVSAPMTWCPGSWTGCWVAVASELRGAGIVSRGLAAVIDLLIVLAVMGIGYLGLVLATLAFSPRAFSFPAPSLIFSTIGIGVVAVAYLCACWSVSVVPPARW